MEMLVKIAVMMMAPGGVPAPPEARGREPPFFFFFGAATGVGTVTIVLSRVLWIVVWSNPSSSSSSRTVGTGIDITAGLFLTFGEKPPAPAGGP